MIRNGRALFISFAIHGLIAAVAVIILENVTREKPGHEARMCISLARYAEPVAKAPVVPPKPKPQNIVQPPKKELPKPKPIVKEKLKPVEKRIVDTPAPVVRQAEPVKEIVPQEPVLPADETPVVEETMVTEAVETAESIPVQYAETTAPEPVPQVSAGERYFEAHLAVISELLQKNLYYPRMARKRGITGEVVVAFELSVEGEVAHIDVTSGEKSILNDAAVRTVERLSGKFPKPSEPITLHVPIRYELQ